MIITKILSRLFIASLITATITNSPQLHTMESETIETNDEIALDADLQAYKLLSTLKNDSQYYLPIELVQTIAMKISKLIDKDCFEKNKTCTWEPAELFAFINTKQKVINHISVANTIKRCFKHVGKSLSEIQSNDGETIFHYIINLFGISDDDRIQCTQIALLIAEEKTWNIICMKNNNDQNAILYATQLKNVSLIRELLSAAPSLQEAWKIISTPNKWGINAIKRATYFASPEIVQLLESYRPQEEKPEKEMTHNTIHSEQS